MKSHQLTSGLILLSTQLSQVTAWGAMGHETVAYVAQNFVTDDTKTYFQDILGDTSSSYLASVAPWADTFRYTSAGAFSAPFHFIDAEDDPPSSCGVELSRDCGDTCIVTAINNYTTRVMDTSESSANRAMAAKVYGYPRNLLVKSSSPNPQISTSSIMVTKTTSTQTHTYGSPKFLGDIHQPLHDENLKLGGNEIDVTYGSESTELHAIWDTNMLEQFIGGDTISDALTWSKSLVTDIKTGTYKSDASSWLTSMTLSSPEDSAVVWAKDSNAYVCSTVMPDGYEVLESEDLSGAYYKKAIPVIELQLAKAGYRLAAWLNLIATGEKGL